MASEASGSRPAGAPEPSDEDLLARHVDGDPDAFGRLFERHRDRLWAVALRTAGDPQDAADALQEAMVSAYRRADGFRGGSRVTTWLHRIVVNACLDRHRANRVRRADPLPDDLDEHHERAHHRPGTPGEASDPAELEVRSEERRRVLAALARLPAPQRAAVVLVDMEGYPLAEVAEMLDCAVGTVKSRCARARARLAVLLGDLVDDLPDGPTRAAPTDTGNRRRGRDVAPPGSPRAPPR